VQVIVNPDCDLGYYLEVALSFVERAEIEHVSTRLLALARTVVQDGQRDRTPTQESLGNELVLALQKDLDIGKNRYCGPKTLAAAIQGW
jgi:hypothetical protein